MGQELPKEFNMRDLFIDVKLEACVDGSAFDFLGRKLFSTEFFRESVGFGITSIDIEVNTSLQPLVSIVFKDLYGATIFGGQNREGSGDDKQSLDYSVLFNWPPAKFLFSFKGYLGKPASWVLNLKKTSTSFNSSDGSYDIKCEFVPNQWGFFADLPFLYLLAAKKLRKDALGPNASQEAKRSVTSVFDLIKIGKQVEVKTQDTTKEFDDLVKQLGSLKSNIARSISVSNIVSFGDIIDGSVNNKPVKNFIKMKIPSLGDLGATNFSSKEKIEQNLGSASSLSKMNTYMLLSIGFEDRNSPGNFTNGFSKFGASPGAALSDTISPAVTKAKNQVIELITTNLGYIDDEIKRVVFSTSEKKLEKITIGEIFSQLAKDAAYIIGSVLDAGLTGYRGGGGRAAVRDAASNKLIGNAFPMIINSEGDEVPAIKANLPGGEDYGVDENEMDFVRRFINAISEGIARDLITDGSVAGQDDAILKQRINNCEMSSGNPYKPFYADIATNILVRGGIVGFMTRSNDPNRPGDFGNESNFDNDGKQQIEEIAVREVQNITDSVIKNLSDVDALLLKRFCKFITRFYSDDGNFFLDDEGKDGPKITAGASTTGPDRGVLMQAIQNGEESPNSRLTFKTIWDELKKPSTLEGVSIVDGEIVYDKVEIGNKVSTHGEFEEKQPTGKINAQNALSFVASDYTATKITNNGLAYTFPHASESDNKYWMVLFRGQDNARAQEANSAPTDIEYKNDINKDDPIGTAGVEEPLGYVPVNSTLDEDDEPLGRVVMLEDDFPSQVLDFSRIKNPNPYFYGAIPNAITIQSGEKLTTEQFLWEGPAGELMKVAKDSFELDSFGGSDYADLAGNFGYTVCHHQTTGSQGALVFGFFEPDTGNNREGRNQRIFVKKVCQQLLQNIEKIEDERNQIIGSVLGKAGEQENAIYKQMHTLYHQWQSLSYSGDRVKDGSLCGDIDENKNGDTFGIAEALEKKYGGNHVNLTANEVVTIEDENGDAVYSLVDTEQSNGVPDGTFIYDFPLQRIRPEGEIVQVRDAIINLEPLYKANGNTTVLNIIQGVCTKNNFLFVPIPGNPDYMNVNDIYTPYPQPANIEIKNFFHVLFTPTPESRTSTRNKDGTSLALSENHETYNANSFVIQYGHPDNQIVSNISVGTDDTKVTAESIVNLQRLVDNENQNKKVTTDCSMLPVLAGRSYKASIDMLGNAQVYPMQFFFLKNSPLFGGLYQVMKVKHNISPNDFKTSVDGMRMRFSPDDGYGSVKPITLETFRKLGPSEAPLALAEGHDAADREAIKNIMDAPPGVARTNPDGTPKSDSAGDTGGEGTTAVIDEGDNKPVGGYTYEKIRGAVWKKGYKWWYEDGDFKLNIVGVRNSSTGSVVTNKFDDYITVSYKENGENKFWSWMCTTQPGDDYMLNPAAQGGTAIVKPGQYINSHIMRKHAGSYMALGQNGPITVYRDNNKNMNYDLDPKTIVTGSGFGINIHRSSPTGTSTNVNNWSAGCQVFANINDFNTFMAICTKAKAAHGNNFTYTLIESKDVG